MPRYFLKLSYKGSSFNGFQIQENAITVQAEVEKAFEIFFKEKINFTGSSRTDSGVHALENYFHFDTELAIEKKHIYNLNAIVSDEIVLLDVHIVKDDAHCRFDANYRAYKYFIYQSKNPFLKERAYFFPYTLNLDLMQEAASLLMQYQDFSSFSKKHTQVNNFNCSISQILLVKRK